MANYNKPVLSQEDLDLFERINRHGFVDMQYIYKFYKNGFNKKTIENRIAKMTAHKFLSSFTTFVPPEWTSNNRTAYKIICLGTAGQTVMKDLGLDVIDYGSALRSKSPYRMYHQVQVSMATETLKESYNDSDSKFKVNHILNEKDIMADNESTQLRNMPDAMILMRNEGVSGLFALFIEVERSYASIQHLQYKITSYSNRIRSNEYALRLKLPIIHSRILFISQTDNQFDVLKEKLQKVEYDNQTEVLLCKYQDVCNTPMDSVYFNLKKNEYIKLMQKM